MKLKLLFAVVSLVSLASLTFAQGQDFSKVEIKATHVAGNVWMLEGSGGNIGVSVGPDGLLIVDDQFAPLADKIKAALKNLGEGKLKFVINTHWHGDHTGGNPIFGKDSTIIAHANVRKRLAAAEVTREGQKVPANPKEALPLITFDETLSVHFNGEEIKAIHFPQGHTDGDGVIFFTGANVVHMGDHMMTDRFPFVDMNSGGSVEGIVRNIGNVLAKLPPDVKIIPGHGPLATVENMRQYQAVLVETVDIVRKQMLAGKKLDEIKAAGLPAKYESWGKGFISTPVWIETIFKSLSKK